MCCLLFAAMLHICSFGLQAFPALAQTSLRFKPTLIFFVGLVSWNAAQAAGQQGNGVRLGGAHWSEML